jgi:hypothetical protein
MPLFRSWPLLVFLAGAALVACNAPAPGDDDARDDDDAGDDDVGDDDVGDDDVADPETACDDLVDNDGDQLIDCEDPDCAQVLHCTWPDAMEHSARFQFHSDVEWLESCETRFTSYMTHTTDLCPQADRTFEGDFEYSINSCDQILELAGIDLPQHGAYGVVFLSEHEREVFGRDTEGVWGSVGTASWQSGVGHYLIARDDDVENIGSLHTEMTFADLP